ncbi:hypothetical protein KLMIMM109B2_18285 [Klebsiella michiganensis]
MGIADRQPLIKRLEPEIEACIGAIRKFIIAMVMLACHIDVAITRFNVHRLNDIHPDTGIRFEVIIYAAGHGIRGIIRLAEQSNEVAKR